jgi:hypothetical protein
MQPRFAIDGPGWSVSFQRRIGAANRGALPFVQLGSPSDRIRVLVPLREGEALWIAVMAGPTVAVRGYAGQDALGLKTWPPAKDGSALRALDCVLRLGRSLPLDAASIDIADNSAAIEIDALMLSLEETPGGPIRRIVVVPATPGFYQAFTGLPAPDPTTERDEYRGWRLP